MDQKILIEALGKHLDLLEKVSYWLLLLCLGILWAGLQRRDINALGMSFNRRQAFLAAITVYLFVNLLLMILFLRIGDLLNLIDPGCFPKAFTTLTTHTWCMNPFAFFGVQASSRIYNSLGFGLLILLWWLCTASLTTLFDGRYKRWHVVLLLCFLAVGIVTVRAIMAADHLLVSGSPGSLSDPLKDISRLERQNYVESFLSIGMGIGLFTIVYRYRDRFSAREEKK